MASVLRCGHRGACGYEPENTLRSFRKALECGAAIIELDVQRCKSGEIVVFHDDKLRRITGAQGSCASKTLEELRRLDAGKGERIPLLHEVFDLVDRRAVINIELKAPDTVGTVAALIDRYVRSHGWSYDRFLVSSFNHYWLMDFKHACPLVRIGVLLVGVPLGYAECGEKLGAYSVHLSCHFVDEQFVEDAHRRGLKVFVWTIDEPDEIENMKRLGVDGIFSNFPDRV